MSIRHVQAGLFPDVRSHERNVPSISPDTLASVEALLRRVAATAVIRHELSMLSDRQCEDIGLTPEHGDEIRRSFGTWPSAINIAAATQRESAGVGCADPLTKRGPRKFCDVQSPAESEAHTRHAMWSHFERTGHRSIGYNPIERPAVREFLHSALARRQLTDDSSPRRNCSPATSAGHHVFDKARPDAPSASQGVTVRAPITT